MKKNYKIFLFILGICLIIIGTCLIMFHKPNNKCEIITVKNDYYVVNCDGNNFMNIPLYFSVNDSVFMSIENINNIYLTTEKNDEVIPLSIEEINYLKEIKEIDATYYQYDLKVNIDLNVDYLTIFDQIYLVIDYDSGVNIKILIGSLCMYNYKQNNEIFYTSLKGVVKEYNNKKMLQCVAVKLNTNEDVNIIDIVSLNNKINVDLENSNVIDYVDDYHTPLDDFIDNNYNIIGKNMNQNNIIVSNGDYLLMYLQYDKYIEIPCVGFIIKYLKNGTVYEKVINPFMYYKTNNLDEEVIKLTYDSNNY